MDSFHIWHKWSLAWEGVSHVMTFDLDLYLQGHSTLFWFGAQHDSIVWVIMRRRGVSSERRRSSCSIFFWSREKSPILSVIRAPLSDILSWQSVCTKRTQKTLCAIPMEITESVLTLQNSLYLCMQFEHAKAWWAVCIGVSQSAVHPTILFALTALRML